MDKYLFQTSELGVSDTGLHLLRSGFNYETIRWNEIDSMRIEKGKELQNWWIIFLLGVALLGLGVYWSVRTIDLLIHKEHAERYAKMLLFLLIPAIGIYFIYNSLRSGLLLRIHFGGNKNMSFPLREMLRDDQLNRFKSLITEKLGVTKVKM